MRRREGDSPESEPRAGVVSGPAQAERPVPTIWTSTPAPERFPVCRRRRVESAEHAVSTVVLVVLEVWCAASGFGNRSGHGILCDAMCHGIADDPATPGGVGQRERVVTVRVEQLAQSRPHVGQLCCTPSHGHGVSAPRGEGDRDARAAQEVHGGGPAGVADESVQ